MPWSRSGSAPSTQGAPQTSTALPAAAKFCRFTNVARVTTAETRFATPRVAAGVLIEDGRGFVLLVKPTYKEGWDLPGGYVEQGESPREAARREVREELGLDIEPGALLVVDWAPHPDEGDKLLFIFDGDGQLVNTDALVLQVSEIEVTEFTSPDLFPERLSRRLQLRVAEARRRLRDVYLEHGSPTSVGLPSRRAGAAS